MDDLTRRNMLKYLAKGAAAGISMSALISCSKDFGIMKPSSPTLLDHGGSLLKPNQADLRKAEKIVKKLCDYDLKGFMLGGKYHPLRHQAVSEMNEVTIQFFEGGPDGLKIVSNFEIVSSDIVEKDIVVQVNYDLLAEIQGESISINNSKERVSYHLKKFDNGLSVKTNHIPFVSKDTVFDHFTDLLGMDVKYKDRLLSRRNDFAIGKLNKLIAKEKNNAKKVKYYQKELEKQTNGYYQKLWYNGRVMSLQKTLTTLSNI